MALALFEPSPRPRFVPTLIFCVLICHQVVTFTRGFWLGLLVSIPLVCILYGRRGQGVRQRWAKVLRMFALIGLIMLPVALIASALVGWSDVVQLVGNRFTSSFQTKSTPETFSNIVRLVELRTAFRLILASPLLGYGHGSTLIVRHVFHPMTGPQWWVHQTYVMIMLKQGILGPVALLWLLYAATKAGVRGTVHRDPVIAGWGAASAACTVFAAVVGLTNYFFFMVTQSYILALVWGITLSLSQPSHWRVFWRAPSLASSRESSGGSQVGT